VKQPAADNPLAALGFDPDIVLLRDAGALLDSHFLGSLHREIRDRMGSEEADPILLQIGFLNGLRDAHRVVEKAFAPPRTAVLSTTPALAIRFKLNREAQPNGAIEVTGTWPELGEAAVQLSLGGARKECGCFLSSGYTSGWLSGTLGADILAVETTCAATGAESCHFVAREAEAWRADDSARAEALLEALSFDAFRAVVREDSAVEESDSSEEAALDRESAVVHIWGPVMVIPFSGADEALRAVELIGHDPGARDVSVIVVDLEGAIVDEAFGAVALEQIVETAETWGAETIFAEVSPLAERVVADLARPPLLVRKDLDDAIAIAFQIARSQRAQL
jgi:hypothetical protein